MKDIIYGVLSQDSRSVSSVGTSSLMKLKWLVSHEFQNVSLGVAMVVKRITLR